MAAPSGTTWGSTVGSYGRIGIYIDVTSDTATQIKYKVQIWFWSKYSVTDSNNTLYYDHLKESGSASTSRGSKSISTTGNSGSGWSTSNQKKIYETTVYTVDRTTSSQKRYIYAKLKDVDAVGGAMYVSRTYTIGAKTSYTVSFNANGGTGAPSSQTKWYGTTLTLSSTKPTRTGYTFQGWGTSATDTSVNYAAGASYTANANATLYAIWKLNTYTVTFDANGGTGAPANQTKTYGQTLVLSSTKPTRTGYDFQGWGTSDTDTTVDYVAGANYTANAKATLYAIWKLKTYTVTFDANGGTGAPGDQTKSYDINLTLSSTKPTRANYNFKGWATSNSSTTVAYNAGGSYTANANITLYAVWELAYVKPTISSILIGRSDENDETGNSNGIISFNWTTFHSVTSVVIKWVSANGEISGSKTVKGQSGTSGTVNETFGNNALPMDQTFTVTITVTDDGGSTPQTTTLDGYVFTIDMLGGGNGVSFGKPAELEGVADFEFEVYFRNGMRPLILSNGTDLNDVKISNTYAGNAASTAGYLHCPITSATSFTLEVMAAGIGGQIMQRITACAKGAPTIYVRHYYSSAWGDWTSI